MIKDTDIRYKFILENKERFKKGIFLNEYDINGKNRVDFALFEKDKLIGYEIKSEADNLKRFIPQLRTYLKIFNYVYLIIHNKYLEEVQRLLNEFKLKGIGLISVSDEITFEIVREPSDNSKIFKVNSILRNLKYDTLKNKCDSLNIKLPTKTSKETLVNKLVGKIPEKEAINLLRTDLIKSSNSCPSCKSNLVYRTSKKFSKITEKTELSLKNKSKIIKKYKITVKVKICRCLECLTEFGHNSSKEIAKELIETKQVKCS